MRSNNSKKRPTSRIQSSLRLYKIPVFGKEQSRIPTLPLSRKVLGHIARS